MKFGIPAFFLALLLPAGVMAATQTVTPSSTAISAKPNQPFEFTLKYTADDLEVGGFGVKMFFDSKKLLLAGLTSVYVSGKAGVESGAQEDKNNEDGDASTDSVINAAWFSVNAKWPGAEKPSVDLYTANFTTATNFDGSTKINFVGDPAANSTVNVQSVTVSTNSAGIGSGTNSGTDVAGDEGGQTSPPPKKSSGSISVISLLVLGLFLLTSNILRRKKSVVKVRG